MLCAFLDDSQKKGWLGLADFVVDSDDILTLEHRFQEALRHNNVPVDDEAVDAEIKWSPGNRNWLRDGPKSTRREALFRELLELLAFFEPVAIGALFHHAVINGYDEERAYAEAYVHTFERIDAFAANKRSPVVVLVDSESGRANTVERVHQTFALVRDRTKYMPLEWIYQHVWAVDSRHHAGIQLADLMAGITTAMASGEDKYAKPLWPLLQGLFKRLKNNDTPQQWSLSVLPTPVRKEFVDKHDPDDWRSPASHSPLRQLL